MGLMTKRGQITIFIVVGILILFAVGFVIFAAKIQPGLQITAEDESEIQQFIGFCLEDEARAAIESVAIQGGYWQVPEDIAINEKAYFSFIKGGQPKIPLWYYREKLVIPSKSFIESEISNRVASTIESCFQNFEVFENKYELTLPTNFTVETVISKQDLLVKIN